MKKVTCTLSITDEPAGVNYTHYWLNFTWSDEDGITFKCPLVEMVDSYGCTFVAHFDKNLTYHGSSFNNMDCFHVHLCYNIDCQSNYDNLTDFEPSKNIQPTAPSHLAVQWTPEGYSYTWQSGYEHHAYMTDFHYQRSFYKYHGDKDEVFHVSSRNNSLLIDGSGHEPDTTYVLKVRSDPNSSEYKGKWSPWSALDWLASECNLIQTYKTQEFLTIDTLIIDAKPIAEDQDCSTTTPYPLSQGQTPYVGPSVMDWVCSHSPNGNGPGDIPYTQLPCSPLELQFGDIVTSLSRDPSVACEGDSGCEDLTLSRDSSLPNSPVSSEPECICTDYCILKVLSPPLCPKRSLLIP
ncbi:unnamed protein product [Coregonus sp. 'balchen']|nr:unnamed protein product [Coregonus sp. 'balchen']